jgi:phosphatidylglycerophosphatase C
MNKERSFFPDSASDPYRTGDWAGYLVLYDFDGTLTRRDSMLPFLVFTLGWSRLAAGLPGVAARFWRRWRSGQHWRVAGKVALLAKFYSGLHRHELEARAWAFRERKLPGLLRPELLEQMRRFRDGGATVAVVSASMDIWLQAFCAEERIGLLCTQARYENDRFTGDLASPNCKYGEKARRIRAAYDLTAFRRIVAFGNTAGDAAMWALADEAWTCDRAGRFSAVESGDVKGV